MSEGERWLRGSDGNAGKIPGQIAERLAGRSFNDFDEFREAFWREVARDPALRRQFSRTNIERMESGRAPFARSDLQLGGRRNYELDHNQEIQHGGNVYDMDNLVVRTPVNHVTGK